jgi:hypothetical protein
MIPVIIESLLVTSFVLLRVCWTERLGPLLYYIRGQWFGDEDILFLIGVPSFCTIAEL